MIYWSAARRMAAASALLTLLWIIALWAMGVGK